MIAIIRLGHWIAALAAMPPVAFVAGGCAHHTDGNHAQSTAQSRGVETAAGGGGVPTSEGHNRDTPKMLITWTNYDGRGNWKRDQARYIVDGKPIGVGREGFDNLLSKIALLPKGSVVYVFPDEACESVLNGTEFATRNNSDDIGVDTVPFRAFVGDRRRFNRLVEDRSLVVRSLLAAPGVRIDPQTGRDMACPYERASLAVGHTD